MVFQPPLFSRRLPVPTLVTVTSSLLFIIFLLAVGRSDVRAKASSYLPGAIKSPDTVKDVFNMTSPGIVEDAFNRTSPDIVENVFNRTLGVSTLYHPTWPLSGLRTNKRQLISSRRSL
jgi:hypothetical protein